MCSGFWNRSEVSRSTCGRPSGDGYSADSADHAPSIPHALVDRVLVDGNHRAVGVVSIELFFEGHYSDTPIMPGVPLVEAMAQLRTAAGQVGAHRQDRGVAEPGPVKLRTVTPVIGRREAETVGPLAHGLDSRTASVGDNWRRGSLFVSYVCRAGMTMVY